MNPDKATLESKNRVALMWAIMGVSICQFLDATIANVALPHMRTSLGASIDSVSWVLTSFIIAGAIVTPITGWLSDRVGSRRLFVIATAGFLISSAMCGAATSLTQMVIFRAIQGATSALMGPLSQTAMFDINPPSKQPAAVSLWGMVSMVAPISGPFIGGFLTEYLNWRWVYYVNLPLGIPALVVIWLYMPSRPILTERKLDLYGFSMIALGLGALQLALDRGQQQDWLESPEIVIELIVAVSCLWMFVVQTIRTRHPLFNPELYKNPNFLAGMAFMTAVGLVNVALAAILPTMYQTIYHYPVMQTGLMMAPRGFGVMLTMIIVNRIVNQVDFRYLASAGFFIVACALWTMTQWSIDMDYHPLLLSAFLQGMGLGLIFTPMNLVAFSSLSPELRTDGSSLLSLFRNIGGSFGISYIVTMLARTSQASHADIGANVTATSVPGVDLPAIVDLVPGLGSGVIQMIDGEVSRQAMMIAYLNNFHVLFWGVLLLVPMPFLLKKPNRGVVFHTPATE